MQYNRLGDTGLIVSRFALGTMTFGSSEGIFKAISKVSGQDLANELIERNQLDMSLHQVADAILTRKLAEYRACISLQQLYDKAKLQRTGKSDDQIRTTILPS